MAMAKSTSNAAFIWFGRLMLIVSVFLVASGIWVDVQTGQILDHTALLLAGMGFLTFGINPALYTPAPAKPAEKPAAKPKKKKK